MSFRLELDEPIGRGLRRIAREQLGRAEKRLADSHDPTTVHEVRKSLKRVRALLRLVRLGIGEHAFKSENARYRDIGRLLSGARDRHVMLETLAALEARSAVTGKVAGDVRAVLSEPVADGAVNGAAVGDPFGEVGKRLTQGRRALDRVLVQIDGFEPIEVGIARNMKAARRNFAAAFAEQTDEAFHEWRKTVQHHWRQMLLLSRAWPAYMTARAHLARDLSQMVGEDHDHGVLSQFVTAETRIDRRAAREVAAACTARQRAIRAHARPLGARLLAEGPNGLARRVALYWEGARVAAATALPDDDPKDLPAGKTSGKPAAARRTKSAVDKADA
jgi:AraC-like DNA-binding protein